jgi:hypothetical protein
LLTRVAQILEYYEFQKLFRSCGKKGTRDRPEIGFTRRSVGASNFFFIPFGMGGNSPAIYCRELIISIIFPVPSGRLKIDLDFPVCFPISLKGHFVSRPDGTSTK